MIAGAVYGIPVGFFSGLIGAALGGGRRGWALTAGLTAWFPAALAGLFLTERSAGALGVLSSFPFLLGGAIAGNRLARGLEKPHHSTNELRRALADPALRAAPRPLRLALVLALLLLAADGAVQVARLLHFLFAGR